MKKDRFIHLLQNRMSVVLTALVIMLSCGNGHNTPDEEFSGTPDAEPASPQRPLIINNTLVSSDRRLLHGGTFWLYGWIPDKTSWALSDAPWKAIRDNHLNVVRVACAYRPEQTNNYSLDQYEIYLDYLIGRADTSGVYIIIDFHPTPGSYNMTDAKAFWTRFASRYKNCRNVIYELVNEPVFSQPENYTDQNLRDFEELWRLTTGLAPNTPVIIMTFCQTGATGRTPKQVTDGLTGIDWTKTVVGFHSYWRNNSVCIAELKEHYPCINTEFHKVTKGSNEMKAMDGYRWHGTLMEKLGVSWTQWDILDRSSNLQYLDSAIINLKANNFYWNGK